MSMCRLGHCDSVCCMHHIDASYQCLTSKHIPTTVWSPTKFNADLYMRDFAPQNFEIPKRGWPGARPLRPFLMTSLDFKTVETLTIFAIENDKRSLF